MGSLQTDGAGHSKLYSASMDNCHWLYEGQHGFRSGYYVTVN